MPPRRSAGLSHSRSTYSAREAAQRGLSLSAWRGAADGRSVVVIPAMRSCWPRSDSGNPRLKRPGGQPQVWRMMVAPLCVGIQGWSVSLPPLRSLPEPGDALLRGSGLHRHPENASMRHDRPASRCAPSSRKACRLPVRSPTCESAWARPDGDCAAFCGRGVGAQLCNETIGNYHVDFIDTQSDKYGWSEQHSVRRLQEYPAL